ncbi:MAG: hypothetical protein JNK87_00800 [Bryobacterales bacterium]|nr:hypothetical protein [Bryobacterales bacterium]
MANRIDTYLTDRALFNTDLLFRVNKWKANYVIPFANGFETAKARFDAAKREAETRRAARAQAAAELQARINMATSILMGLVAPYLSEAYKTLRIDSLQQVNRTLDDRMLSKALASGNDSMEAMNRMIERATVRRFILNDITEHRLPAVAGAVTGQLTPSGTAAAPTAPGTGSGAAPVGVGLPGVPPQALTEDFSAERLGRNLEQVFLTLAGELNEKFMQVFVDNRGSSADQKRGFLVAATKTLIVRPPVRPIDEWMGSADVLAGHLFGILVANYLLSLTPQTGRAGPDIGVDLAFTLNKALSEKGHSIITNNPRMGTVERFPAVLDPQMAWSGLILEPQKRKIREIGSNAAQALEVLMALFGGSAEAV